MSKFKVFFKFLAKHKYVSTIVFFVLLIGFLDSNSLYTNYKLKQEEAILQSEIERYEKLCNEDTKRYNQLQENRSEEIVRIARENNMKTDNEDVYVFSDEVEK